MAIEIIPKKVETKLPTLLNILFYLALILLIISLLSSLALFLFQKNSKKVLQNIEEKLAEKGTPEERALEGKIILYQKKINDFSDLLNSHQSNLKFLTVLESLTHPKIFFSKVDLKIREGKVILAGTAENFEVLGQQFLIFKKENFIKDVSLTKVSISKEGKIDFNLELSLEPEKFKY